MLDRYGVPFGEFVAPVEQALLLDLPPKGVATMTTATAVDLPEHVADAGEWKDWPRKLDAHVQWGVRMRQVEAYTRNGRLKVWACPDGTKRIEPDSLRELFGEPGVVQGGDRDISAAERRRRQADAAAGLTLDPTVLMFRAAVDQMNAMHQASISLIKVVSDPLKALLDAYSQTIAAQHERIRQLETAADEATVLRSELTDAKQERDIALKRFEASERRKDDTISLLKDQLPALVSTWLSGDTLSGFGKRAPRDVVETIVDSGTISEQDSDLLRRAAGIPKPAQEQTQTKNSEVNHGHS